MLLPSQAALIYSHASSTVRLCLELNGRERERERERERGQRVEWLIVMLSGLKRAGQVL